MLAQSTAVKFVAEAAAVVVVATAQRVAAEAAAETVATPDDTMTASASTADTTTAETAVVVAMTAATVTTAEDLAARRFAICDHQLHSLTLSLAVCTLGWLAYTCIVHCATTKQPSTHSANQTTQSAAVGVGLFNGRRSCARLYLTSN